MLGIPFMRHALIASLLISGMLAYLGIHVVRRRIVFVDLAIAQLSAVGVVTAIVFEHNPLVFSLIFTLIGAALLSLPAYERRIPQEAIMGIVYAVASAVAILIVAKTPKGESDILNLFFGNILAVSPGQIIGLTAVLGSVAFIHGVFFKRLSHVPSRDAGSSWEGLGQMGWNLMFYLTLAVVIAMAIRTAGVLLVFSNLVIPAVTALILTRRIPAIIAFSIGFGLLANWTGLFASYRFDLPSGPSIVVTLGCFLIFAAIGRSVLTFWAQTKRGN